MAAIAIALLTLHLWNTKRAGFALVFLSILVTNGFQLIPASLLSAGTPIEKPSDIAILIIFLISALRLNRIFAVKQYRTYLYLALLFFAYLIFNALYSVFLLDYEAKNIIQVFRNYLWLLIFPFFLTIPGSQLRIAIKYISLLTIGICLLYLLQLLINRPILLSSFGTKEVTQTVASDGFNRFYNLPSFLYLATFYTFSSILINANKWSYAKLAVLLITVLAPLHRILIASALLTIALYSAKRQSITRIMVLVLALIVTTGLLFSTDIAQHRLLETSNDLFDVLEKGINLSTSTQPENTMIFRLSHLFERFSYVSESPSRWIFGIGLISDNSSIASSLPFSIGLTSLETGQIVKIDTSDILWSLPILNLGLLGTLLAVVMLIALTRSSVSECPGEIVLAKQQLFVFALLSSIGSIELLQPYFLFSLGLMMYTTTNAINRTSKAETS